MVTNRDRKSFESRPKIPKVAQATGAFDVFELNVFQPEVSNKAILGYYM